MHQRNRAVQFASVAEAKCRAPTRGVGLTTYDGWSRYLRLYWMCASTCLIREMTFRGNFLVRCGTHVAWVALQLVFFQVIYLHTERIGTWDKFNYLFFLGTFLTLNGLVNSLFIGNCTQFSELVRTGNLDYVLLKPIDEQFLISCQRVDWAMIPEILFSVGVTVHAAVHGDAVWSPARVLIYITLLAAGLAILYSLLLVLAASSVWTVRQQELYELWFYVLQFASYPSEIYGRNVAGVCLSFLLTYVLPILVAVNVPARFGTMLLESWKPAVHLLLVACAGFAVSRWFLHFALRSYRSASS